LIRALGGHVEVSSRLGAGTCFRVYLPLVAEPPRDARIESAAPKRLEGARVLVVEDDAAVRSLIELALEARGADTVLAGNQRELDQALAKGIFDVALVDLSPIAENATGALARLRATNPGIPVILISGVASGVSEEVTDRVTAWVRKPFEMGEVIEVLGSHLAPSSASIARRPR